MRKTTQFLALVTIAWACASPIRAAESSPEALFQRLSALTESGNADIKYNLGMFLNNGIGTKRDNKAAFRYFSEAAEAGSVLASYKVGCYYAGQFPDVVPLDEQAALKFKLQAAEAGYELAQHDVALHLGKKGDIAGALAWWEKASRQANLPSTAYLANYLSRPDSKHKAKGFALMLILKERMPNTSKELSDRLAALQAELSDEEKQEAASIRASWLTGPTPVTMAARAGMSSVPALLSAVER
ncbi:MAG: sel1 repeat family protein [Burkholderiaceae bacterium]|nr:sel1 repeat family protein [Burkholderiaceae bacterium]